MLIEKIWFNTDEVGYYPWLTSTKADIIISSTDVTNSVIFTKLVALLLHNGLLKANHIDKEKIRVTQDCESNSVHFEIEEETDSEKVIEYLRKAAEWILNTELTFPESLKEYGQRYIEYKRYVDDFFGELIQKLNSKDYKCHYQYVDGMN